MASSRWKRFAFFDRNNLKLPLPIVQDILPPNNNNNNNNEASLVSSYSNNNTNLNNNHSNKNDKSNRLELSENVSLVVVNGAGIPYASIPENKSNAGMALSLHSCNHNQIMSHESEKEDEHRDQSHNKNNNNNNNNTFSFTSTGQTLAVPNNVQKKHGNVDGSLVLAFIASKSSSRVHCVDLTIRCNPIQESKSSMTAGTTGTDASAAGAGVVQQQQQQQQDMEDLDGWRGYFTPFHYDLTIYDDTESGTPSSNNNQAKIVAMAVCSDHETKKIKSGKNMYLACITDSNHSVGITVHRNPHLYLNDDFVDLTKAAATTTTTKKNHRSTPKKEVFQPLGEFDYKHRGRPTCVAISYQSGLVAVGTNNGMILLYNLRPSNSGGHGHGHGSDINASQVVAGSNLTRKLTCVMEIPAPPTAGRSGNSSVDDIRGGKVTAGNTTTSGNSADLNNVELEASCLQFVRESVHIENNESQRETNATNKSTKKEQKRYTTKLFVTYRRRTQSSQANNNITASNASTNTNYVVHCETGVGGSTSGSGVCCYDLGIIDTAAISKFTTQSTPTARFDLDGREVTSTSLCDMVVSNKSDGSNESDVGGDRLMIARSDGLYTYSSTDKVTVSPIDGNKIAMCSVPPPPFSKRKYRPEMLNGTLASFIGNNEDEKMTLRDSENIMYMQAAAADTGSSYTLVATTDTKSGRDAIDIYDASNKLVAFHILLSPGHKALKAVGITTASRSVLDGTIRGGLSSAIVITTGGSLVTITEKITSDKVALLIQKNLYSAAISMAFADSSYKAADITSLFRRHAEYLYRKGDYVAAMDQYIHTIGSLEPSHVIFRFLDAPKIPLLARYLETLRSRNLADSVHCELLKTCYLKLNDLNMAEKTSSLLSKSLTGSTCTSLVSNLLHSPSEALATICSFEAPHVVAALKVHGSVLARASPRETAGIVLSLCDGIYSPGALASVDERRKVTSNVLKELLESKDREQKCELYPIHLFSTAFMENPKLLRVILAHCLKNKRYLTSSLKRTFLGLTLDEWNTAKKADNKIVEKTRRDEAMSILSDPTSSEKLGDYESLVIVQQHDFVQGEILLYERLQMIPLLVEKYANEGTYKARRQMLALCRSDPEILGDVLGHFVSLATEKLNQKDDDASVDSESELGELLQDVKEALQMARSQNVLPPVRIARILAGYGVGQFRNESDSVESEAHEGVPLSVAIDYIGNVLDEKGKEIDRLQSDVEEYDTMCEEMETEINSLSLSKGNARKSPSSRNHQSPLVTVDVDEMYDKLLESSFEIKAGQDKPSELHSEEFWRAMGQSEDRFGTIAKFFAKDIIN